MAGGLSRSRARSALPRAGTLLTLLNAVAATVCLCLLLLSGPREVVILAAGDRPRQQQRLRSNSCKCCGAIEPTAEEAEPSPGGCELQLAEMRLVGADIASAVHPGRNCSAPALLAQVVSAEAVTADCELQHQLLKLASRLGAAAADRPFTLLQDCTEPPCCPGLLEEFASDHAEATVLAAATVAEGAAGVGSAAIRTALLQKLVML